MDPSLLRTRLAAAIRLRSRVDVGQPVRAIDRDNIGHVTAIDDIAGTCTTQFDNTRGGTAIKIIEWADLIAIDDPEPVELTASATNALAIQQAIVETAEREWANALAAHGVLPGDADLYRRAVRDVTDRAALGMRAEPPQWLTTWIGIRPATSPGAAVWDDATTRIAEHRTLHNVTDEPGIGHRPVDRIGANQWDDLMLRLIHDRIWLAANTPPHAEPTAPSSHAVLAERRQELERLLETAPADRRQLINRIVNSQLNSDQLHDYLTAATAGQNERRDWIIANWPHIVELEQVTKLLAAHEHTAQPAAVRDMLNQLRNFAPDPDRREERALAEIADEEINCNPVRRLEAERGQLQQMARHPLSADEREALDNKLNSLNSDLRQARREWLAQATFDRYVPTAFDEARTARLATLATDTLTSPPTWLVEHVTHLHDRGLLHAVDVRDLATQLVAVAAHVDQHGQLPQPELLVAVPGIGAAPAGIELG
jgi:hypothetical protein